jgi:hypothetical protein
VAGLSAAQVLGMDTADFAALTSVQVPRLSTAAIAALDDAH